jgi:hypothetical protein
VKGVLLFVLFLAVFDANYAQKGQKIPRKLRGTYLGSQPAYTFRQQGQTFQFSELAMKITIAKQTVELCYPNEQYCPLEQTQDVTITSKKEGRKKMLYFSVRVQHSSLPEEWILDVKSKKILRKGLAPQPDTRLVKSRKEK